MLRNALIAATLALIPAAASAAPAWTTAGVNFRDGPSTYYTVVATLPYCAAIQTYEWQNGWVRAEWQGQWGWVAGNYITESNAHCAPGYQAPAYQAPAYHAPAYQAPTYPQPAYQAPATGGYRPRY